MEYLKTLQLGDRASVNKTMIVLHRRLYQQVLRFVKKSKGTSLDAEDVFQEGLLALYMSARKGDLPSYTDVEAYLFGICRNTWLQKLKKAKDVVEIDEESKSMKLEEVVVFKMMKKEEVQEVRRLMGKMGGACKEVLIDYYFHRNRMNEIAEKMGYSSGQVAKNKKSSCIKKLRKLMMDSEFFSSRFGKKQNKNV